MDLDLHLQVGDNKNKKEDKKNDMKTARTGN